MLLVGLIQTPQNSLAATAPTLATPGGLSLAEIKITGNEFVMLQNNSGAAIPDLSKYWLYVFNNLNPLAVGVSSSTQQLPAGNLAPGQTVLLSGGGATCGAAITAKLALSLNDSGGFLEVVQTSLSSGVLIQTAGDAVSWSSGANPATGMIANVPSNSSAPNGAWYRYNKTPAAAATYGWQQADVDPTNACQLSVTISGVTTPGPLNPGNQLLPGSPPPATIVTADPTATTPSSGPALPATDVGLAAPQITELLPNPASPQSDSEDEFIELYNSNAVTFDLTGFTLEVGTTTVHDYHFPAGSQLPASGWLSFMSIDTGLSLSNSGGRARLLDPFGAVISQSDVYGTAKDGQAWALANGTWYWTTTPTPNAANVINQPLTIQNLSVGTPTPVPTPTKAPAIKTSTSSVKTASTSSPSSSAKTSKTPSTPTTNTNNNANSAANNNHASSPLHPVVLAGVGGAALLYALYEYRHDLANRLHQFRRHREIRRATRQMP